MTKMTHIAGGEVGQVGWMSHGFLSKVKHVVTWLGDRIRIRGIWGDCWIPIKIAFDLLTTSIIPLMSQCHQYNFTTSTLHADSDMLASIVPWFEAPSSPSVYTHGPDQVARFQQVNVDLYWPSLSRSLSGVEHPCWRKLVFGENHTQHWWLSMPEERTVLLMDWGTGLKTFGMMTWSKCRLSEPHFVEK